MELDPLSGRLDGETCVCIFIDLLTNPRLFTENEPTIRWGPLFGFGLEHRPKDDFSD